MELATFGFALSLLWIGWADWRWRTIRHATTLPLIMVALWLPYLLPAGSRLNAGLGALTSCLLFFGIWCWAEWWYGRPALGFGDVTLATLLGAVGGLFWGFWMLAIGMLLAGGFAASMMLMQRRTRLDTMPYGLFLSLGGIVGLLLFYLFS